MKAADIALQAAHLVAGERDRVHGNKPKNFGDISSLWSAYLRRLFPGIPRDLRPHEAATMMELMKIARRLSGAHNIDDYTDGAGYAACAGELAHLEHVEWVDPMAVGGAPEYPSFDARPCSEE